jgi:hypothetical protein
MRNFWMLTALCALIGGCTTSTSSDPEPLRLHEVVYGGCAGLFDMPDASPARTNAGYLIESPDTLIIAWADSLEIFLGLNYICCAPFAADYGVAQDTLLLYVSDTCSVPYTTCYCRCMCYYTFTWKFAGGEEDVGNLRVELFDPRAGAWSVLYRQQLAYH